MSFSSFDYQCMAQAMQLAARGMNSTHPNPRVGCVVAQGSRVVGRAYHQRAGEPHAEILALIDAGEQARGATVYVTLEPCSHHGLTPPCSKALIEAGVSRVVFAMQDPNKVVNGAGQKELLDAGIVVEHGLMAQAAEELNPGFLQRMRLGRPFVRVKMAASLDGRTALANGTSKWITSEAARQDVQRWRARSSAILTGIGTILADNPRMTARLPFETMQPVRVVVDSAWRTPPDSKIVKQAGKTIIAGSVEKEVPKALLETGVQCLPLEKSQSGLDLLQLMQALAAESLNEVQVEAGAMLCGSLLRESLVDELLLYQAPVLLGDGGLGLFAGQALESMQQRTRMQLIESCFIGSDQRLRLRPVKAEKVPD